MTNYLYDGGLPVIEKDGTGNTLATYTRGLSSGGGIGGIISANREGNSYYYHYNGIGSVTGLTNSASAVVGSYNYDSYGNTLSSTGSIPNPYGFSTKEYSSASGLAYFGARYYKPEIGRWLSQDPLGMVNGPNLYAYVNNNPTNLIDPYGLYVDWGAVGGAIGGAAAAGANSSGGGTGQKNGECDQGGPTNPDANSPQVKPRNSNDLDNQMKQYNALKNYFANFLKNHPAIPRLLWGVPEAALLGIGGAIVGSMIEPGIGTVIGAAAGSIIAGVHTIFDVCKIQRNLYKEKEELYEE